MIVKWYAHLPGVVLESFQQWSFGAGRLAHIPFSEWSRFDASFPFNENHYERSQPVFYTGEVDLPDDLDQAREYIGECVHVLYLAFLLAQEAPVLPSPAMSVMYLLIPSTSNDNTLASIFTSVGPFEREWIVFGGKIHSAFDDARLSSVRRAYNQIIAFDPDKAFSGVTFGLDVLEFTALPEFWWHNQGMNLINGFVHCMAALEHLLLPLRDEAPAGMKLTPAFGQHAAVITNASREDLHKQAKYFSSLYRLRSRLIHGEIGLTQLTDQEWNSLHKGRQLLGTVLLQAMVLWQNNNKHGSLPLLLARAFKDADFHQSLFS